MKQDGMGLFQSMAKRQVRPDRGRAKDIGQAERARLEAEAQRRFAEQAPAKPEGAKTLSRVERAMRRNAPDLAGGSPEEIAAAKARRQAHHNAKWPRPRLLALLVLMVSATLNPLPFLRLAVWAVILFLVVSVVAGPERARDFSTALGRRFAGLWRHEIVVLRKGIMSLRRQIDLWVRTAL